MSRTLILLAAAWALAGCTGALGDGAARPMGTPGVTPRPGPIPASICDAEIQPGTSPFRRLTRDEYDATLEDLLGDTTHPASAFPPDEDGLGFDVGATVSPLLAELYLGAAEDIAVRAVARLDAIDPCDVAREGEEGCARAFATRVGRRAYRTALDAELVEGLLDVYRVGRTEGDHRNGMRLMITAMITSPFFLYRVELDPPDLAAGADVVPLSMDERATRLSYFLWGSMPDDDLFAAADAGELATAAEIEAQARRMLDASVHPRARLTMERFAMQWLELELEGVSKDPEVYPAWDDELSASMDEETRRFVDHVIFESSGTLDELFTADYTFVDARLAALYGVEMPSGAEWARVSLDPTRRAGLLTHASLLAQHARTNQSSPVFRGRFVRERLLCQSLPPPPEGLVVVPPEPDPSSSTRTRYEEHRSNPACAGCHQLMDPIGFALEHYDGIGRYRDTDEGFDVDARGAITATRADATVDGAVELAHALVESPDVEECLTSQLWTFAFRRMVIEADACSIAGARRIFAESGRDIRELLVAIATSDAFLYRRPTTEEVSP